MAKAYYHFSKLYNNSNETLLCVDCDLRVVYISDVFRLSYDFNVDDGILTGCFIPSEYFVRIQKSIDNQVSFSFDFICSQDGAFKKCFVLPCALGNDKFATLLIVDANKSVFEQSQNYELKTHILEVEQNINDYANEILTLSRRRSKKLYEDLKDNKILLNTLKIRREFEYLSTVSKKELSSKEHYLIAVNEYIKRTKELIIELLGDNRIDFEFDFYPKMLVTYLCYDIFDILLAHSITACIKNTKGLVKLYIKTKPYEKGSMVIISDSFQNCLHIESMISSAADFEEYTEYRIIQKAVKSYDGKFTAHKNSNGRLSVAFTLPPKPDRLEYLRETEKDVTANNVLTSAFAAIISDVLNN